MNKSTHKKLKDSIEDIFGILKEFDDKTKSDIKLIKSFSNTLEKKIEYWNRKNLFSRSIIRKGDTSSISARSINQYIDDLSLNHDKRVLAIDYEEYKNYEFDGLLFFVNNLYLVDELKKTLENIKELATFRNTIQDHLLMLMLDSTIAPSKIRSDILLESDKKQITADQLDDLIGSSITMNFKQTDDLFQKSIYTLFEVSSNNDFPSLFISFLKTMIKAYNENEIKKEYLPFLREIMFLFITLLMSYDKLVIKSNSNVIKPFTKTMSKIKKRVNNGELVEQNLIKSLTDREDLYKNYLSFEKETLELLDLINDYNLEISSLIISKEKKKEEYIDEDVDIFNFEKQMIDEYLNQNVFAKFTSINSAYNPSVVIDAEELYRNIPCINKKEGYTLMMKKLKSFNVNHEINNLIIKLNLIHKGKSKSKKTRSC